MIGAAPPDVAVTFDGVSTDTRTLRRGQVYFGLSGERFDGNAFVADALAKGAALAVTSQAGPGPRLVVADVLGALQSFAAAHRRRYRIPILAITGSCGKTSSKDLTAAVLATRWRVVKTTGNLNNEIGCPLSLLQIGDDTQFAVIEMGANHGGEIARLCELARPTEAAITLVAPAHLEGFGTVEHVAAAKGEIVAGLGADGLFYVNADDPWCMRIAEGHAGGKVYFGREAGVSLRSCEITGPGRMVLDVNPVGRLELPLSCRAHAMNVLLAIAVGLRHGITKFQEPLERACVGAARFRTLQAGPLTIIDDTYNANPASMRAALEALAEWPAPGRRYAALGEMLELGAAAADLHYELGVTAGRLKIDTLYAVGPHAGDMARGAESAGAAAVVAEEPAVIAEMLEGCSGPGDVLLVKGSRGMRMERVIDALRARFS